MQVKTSSVPPAAAAQGWSVDGDGGLTAVFSTLNVVDRENDVTLPGAFAEGAQTVISAYGHTSHAELGGRLPVGKGRISTVGDQVLLRGQFFMSTFGGREAYQTVRELGPLGRWSYGYDVLDSEPGLWKGTRVRFLKSLHVIEVSPVLDAVGVNTRTLDPAAAADLLAIRSAILSDQSGEEAAREYARHVQQMMGAGR